MQDDSTNNTYTYKNYIFAYCIFFPAMKCRLDKYNFATETERVYINH